MSLRFDVEVLVLGRGAPITDASVVVDEGVVSFAGPRTEAPDADETVLAPVAMPGLWDCHAHLFGFPPGRVGIGETLPTQPPQLGVLRAARQLERALRAGFTSIREVGGYGTYLATAVEEGLVNGPTVYAAGSPLSQTGGHADVHHLPEAQAVDLFERHFGASSLCDGPDDCRRLVRRQLRLGARVIKVCASGGVMSQVDDPIHQQFTVAELSAIVDEAARADRVVAAHCHGKPGIMAALEAGVRTIEHGTYLDEEGAKAMVETGTVLVPTRFIVEHLVALGTSPTVPEYARRKILAVSERHREAMSLAVESGVTIALGTDIWGADTWGRNAEELGHLVAAGLTPLQAIETATANGPLTLGPQAPRAGVLEPGADADLITVDSDPTVDVAVLADPANITGVWRRGKHVA